MSKEYDDIEPKTAFADGLAVIALAILFTCLLFAAARSVKKKEDNAMGVRAKMKCEYTKVASDGFGGEVRLRPVISGSAENEAFYKYTPGGELVLATVNEAAFAQFEEGKEYYLDISPAVESTGK